MKHILNENFDWQRCPEVGRQVATRVDRIVGAHSDASRLRQRMLDETGTRLIDWVDHLSLPLDDPFAQNVEKLGYVQSSSELDGQVWRHPQAMVPTIRFQDRNSQDLFLRVDSVKDFIKTHNVANVDVTGGAYASLRSAIISQVGDCRLGVVERHGNGGFETEMVSREFGHAIEKHHAAFSGRERVFMNANGWHDELVGFPLALALIDEAIDELGVNRTCDLFFQVERSYWEQRNHAARVQKQRQDRLGLGWGNHDHHTYRSSRECFASLIGLLERLGFACRERFYGGAEAGWGAQVLEQSDAGIIVFADVDLSPDEVAEDFAHQGLTCRDELGTVGLWCKLHGEAIMLAGMHHLECQFDFEAACSQLTAAGVPAMKPFTDFVYLKQAFTTGEVWDVDPVRLEYLLQQGQISSQQAEQFLKSGAVGSHLEILQRDEGYKGFNQTGISEIIRATDPRHHRGS